MGAIRREAKVKLELFDSWGEERNGILRLAKRRGVAY